MSVLRACRRPCGVRPGPPKKLVRSSERHQVEKDLALLSEAERAGLGEAETNLNMSIDDQEFSSHYDVIPAGDELAGSSTSARTTSCYGDGTKPAIVALGYTSRTASRTSPSP